MTLSIKTHSVNSKSEADRMATKYDKKSRSFPGFSRAIHFMHQIHLAAYGLLDTGCTQSAKSVFTEVAHNSLRIPRVFHVQRNPRVFQVFEVCGQPGSETGILDHGRINTELDLMLQHRKGPILSALMYPVVGLCWFTAK